MTIPGMTKKSSLLRLTESQNHSSSIPTMKDQTNSSAKVDGGGDEEQPAAVISPAPPMANTKLCEYDRKFFQQVIQDAGRWAYGVIAIEVWVLNKDRTHLVRPDYGWWIDPVATDFGQQSKFDRLIDPTNSEYLEPAPLAPGIGLPGLLWSMVREDNAAATTKRRTLLHNPIGEKLFSGGRLSGNLQGQGVLSSRGSVNGENRYEDQGHSTTRHKGLLSKTVIWHQVQPLCDDPDQPYNPRLQYLAQIGLGWAAGVAFNVGESSGLVMYLARDTCDPRRLQSETNEEYMIHASLVIGAAYALRGPRLDVQKERENERKRASDKLRAKVKMVIQLNKNLDEVVKEEEEGHITSDKPHPHGNVTLQSQREKGPSLWGKAMQKISCWAKKALGAANKAPPPFTWQQTAWTFVGCFLTLSTLTTLNTALVRKYGGFPDGISHSIILGPFGALMTLQYGLTAAPASQPRNAILGQFIGLIIAQSIGQALNLETWLKQTLATALAISCMVKLGVTHPPAGAAAMIFSNGTRTWQQVGMMLLGNVIAIVCATIVNNLSDKRQYPTFWGFQPIIDLFQSEEQEEKKKN